MKPVAVFRFSQTEHPGRFGSWLTRHGIPWELIPIDEGVAVPASPDAYSGIGMMGGPMSVNDRLPWIAPLESLIRDAITDGTPVIGHCLGGQLMAKALGAKVSRMPAPEIGWFHVDVADRDARREWFKRVVRHCGAEDANQRNEQQQDDQEGKVKARGAFVSFGCHADI